MARIRQPLSAIAACVMLMAVGVAHALECPVAQPTGRAGVIAEPTTLIAALAPVLSGPDASGRAAEIVAQTRQRYPGAQPDEIVNFLVTAYCPVVNAQSLPESEKQSMVSAFAAAVMRQLY
jgi:hypothetical protein